MQIRTNKYHPNYKRFKMMKNLIKQLFLSALTLLTVVSCSKDELKEELTPPVEKQIEIYTAGYVEVPAGGTTNQVATVWKNGISQSLAKTDTESSANKVLVVGNDVYVVGREYVGSKSVARLWKNGIATTLINSNINSETFTVTVSASGDVYTLIREWSNIGSEYKVLKNGTVVSLNRTNSNNKIYPYDLFVSGNDVYVTGVENDFATNRDKATLWKNGVPTNLQSVSNNMPTSGWKVFVSGNDVYVLGTEDRPTNDIIVLWKNGIPTSITDGTKDASVYALFVAGTDVYVTGREYNTAIFSSVSTLWTNGASIFTRTGNEYDFTSVSILNNNVYLAGEGYFNGSLGYLWKNGEQVTPQKENTSYSSVFVVEK